MSQRFASRTTVSAAQSKTEIENLLRRYGADQFIHGWEPGRAVIGFRIREYPVRMTLPIPDIEDFLTFERKTPTGIRTSHRDNDAARRMAEQAERQAWRALTLMVKAKLEAVEAGITSIEHQFLPDILLPQDITVGQEVLPHIQEAVQSGRMPRILPGAGNDRAIPLPPASSPRP